MFTIDKHKLKFSHKFNEPICRNIVDIIKGNNITEIIFGWDFNQLIDNLPNGIKNIIFCSYYYDLPIDNLPNTIELIKLSKYFDHPLDNLPEGLINLYLSNDTNYDLNNLPNTLELLRSGNRDIKINILPQSLKELTLPRYHLYKIDCFPPNLLTLQISYYYNYELDNLPPILDKLIIAGGPQEYYNIDVSYPEFNQPINDLPDSVSEIEICVSEYNLEITKLPNNLDSIMFHSLAHVPTPDLEIINSGQAMFYCRCMDCKNAFFQQKYM